MATQIILTETAQQVTTALKKALITFNGNFSEGFSYGFGSSAPSTMHSAIVSHDGSKNIITYDGSLGAMWAKNNSMSRVTLTVSEEP